MLKTKEVVCTVTEALIDMDSLPAEVQKALAAYRKVLADSICREQKLREENDALKQLLTSHQEGTEASVMLLTDDADLWRQECLRMQESLSWRITKPLRLVKKVIRSLQTVGLKLTLVKIFKRWK